MQGRDGVLRSEISAAEASMTGANQQHGFANIQERYTDSGGNRPPASGRRLRVTWGSLYLYALSMGARQPNVRG